MGHGGIGCYRLLQTSTFGNDDDSVGVGVGGEWDVMRKKRNGKEEGGRGRNNNRLTNNNNKRIPFIIIYNNKIFIYL